MTGASPAVIEDRFRHLVMILAIDDSGSTYGFYGTDPRGVRYAVTADADRGALLGTIGRQILTGLLPPRRQRLSTRKVKSPMSRHSERHADGRPDTSRTVTRLDVTVLEPVDQSPAPPTASRDDRHAAPAARRRHRILTLLQEEPTRLWQPREIADRFGDVTLETMYRQLNRWAVSGLIHKLGPGLYAATPWSPGPLA
ncbi:hypothetical protein BGM19_02040 [Streptomyces agglomeratus]|uniref:helix-turn-helix domain-containing protein n=1 Tax=Streptomyces agglomeratus TaxID=285458 RepID=UPI000852766C|nr:helix-turn-helix domain-containing protein [Streptomyces agglomeratus]OEJ56980.1 hypothetical protein BGM19_02040 [Streptomyces agglomeratus]